MLRQITWSVPSSFPYLGKRNFTGENGITVFLNLCFVDKVRTVSETKRNFYSYHTRPIQSIYRRVIEELMVEMHLLSVNVDFYPNPIYCLGVVTTFDRFMEGYRPESDQKSIFHALCQSIGEDDQNYRQNAEALISFAQEQSIQELVEWIASPTSASGIEALWESISKIANNPKFKYSRLFAIGLYTLLETADSEFVQDNQKLQGVLKQFVEALPLSMEKLEKDLELYRGNLEKMAQARTVMEDIIEASRKKREQRSQPKEEPEAPEATVEEAPEVTTPAEEDSSEAP